MLMKNELKVGDVVMFGRRQGEHTKAKVVKLNPTKAVVETLELRGKMKRHAAGSTWNVPYSLLYRADDSESNGDDTPPLPKLTYNPFATVENHILMAITALHVALSPENLTGDGELPRATVARRHREYTKTLRHLFAAIGREVDEEDAYAWSVDRRKHEEALTETH